MLASFVSPLYQLILKIKEVRPMILDENALRKSFIYIQAKMNKNLKKTKKIQFASTDCGLYFYLFFKQLK